MLHMFDIDTASCLVKDKSPAIETKLAALLPSMVCISVMTRAEMRYGLKRSPSEHRVRAHQSAAAYAELRLAGDPAGTRGSWDPGGAGAHAAGTCSNAAIAASNAGSWNGLPK